MMTSSLKDVNNKTSNISSLRFVSCNTDDIDEMKDKLHDTFT